MYNNELAETKTSQNPMIDEMASQGRKGDTMMAHVTPGDYVIPKNILVQHPEFLVKLKKVFQDENQDYRNHMVGSGFENINPETGSPEFGFGRSFKKFVSQNISQPVANLTGSQKLGAGVGAVLGGSPGWFVGAPSLYNQAMRDMKPAQQSTPQQPYSPTAMDMPESLQDLQGLTDQQKRSYISTQATQGQGVGEDTKNYYANLLQRNIKSDPAQNLLPVEQQYLQQRNINPALQGQSLIEALRGF